MDNVRLKRSSKPRLNRVCRPVPRYNSLTEFQRDTVHVKEFVRALTRFQPHRNTWQEEVPAIQSCVSSEFRRLHRRSKTDVVITPRSPYAEFRPRSAHPDCKKEFVPKTNICFENPEIVVPRRVIRSAPPGSHRREPPMMHRPTPVIEKPPSTPRTPGRFEHHILQDEYFELHTMLRRSVASEDSVTDIISRNEGLYSHRFPATNHRIFCVDEHVGSGYFKRFRNDLLSNLTLDMNTIKKKLKHTEVLLKADANDVIKPDEVHGHGRQHLNSARSVSSRGSLSSFNSQGEVQTNAVKDPVDSESEDEAAEVVSKFRDNSTSTEHDFANKLNEAKSGDSLNIEEDIASDNSEEKVNALNTRDNSTSTEPI